jgi:transposase-like protein
MNNNKKVLKKRKNDLSFPDFQEKFSTEEDCRKYLFQKRWPKGFICPKCGNTTFYELEDQVHYQCARCKRQTSVTAGTLMHKTHLQLRYWFWAIYLISRDKRGISAVALKNALKVSYPTAWHLLHKIRIAMGSKEQDYVLNGVIVLDDAFFGGKTKGKKRGRGTEKANVIVAVSLNKDQKSLFAKMLVVENLKDTTISPEIKKIIETGSVLRTDAHQTLANLQDYLHEVIVSYEDPELAESVFHWVNVIIANAKSFILGTFHGLPKKYLSRYLDEYCYRFNRRFCEHQIFAKLVNACIIASPAPYAEQSL